MNKYLIKNYALLNREVIADDGFTKKLRKILEKTLVV